jgi:hypothetical protein
MLESLSHGTSTAAKFLALPAEERRTALAQLGLLRYAPLFVFMAASTANIAVLGRWFAAPDRVKFPDLRGADLAHLDLSRTNLIRADLTGADLRGAVLRQADLLFARLVDADLTDADLRGATLNESVWQGARVTNCLLTDTVGLTASQRISLGQRGAVL